MQTVVRHYTANNKRCGNYRCRFRFHRRHAINCKLIPAKIVIIESKEFSFGRALNIGYQNTNNDIVVNASAHVYPIYETWLEKLTAPFANPEVALTYGMQRGNQVTKLSEHQIFLQLFPDQAESAPAPPFCNNANAAGAFSARI